MTHVKRDFPRGGLQDLLDSVPDRLRLVGQVIVQSVRHTFSDGGTQWAAALAYYAILSAFPVVVILGVIVSFFIDPQEAVRQLTNLLGDFVPEEQRIQETVNSAINARGRVGLIAGAGLLWTGTRVFDTLARAMNAAFGIQDGYAFWKRLLIEVVMLVTIGVILIVAIFSRFLLDPLLGAIQFLPSPGGLAMTVAQGVIHGVLLLLAYFLVYRFVPRESPDWRAALAGAGSATALFLIVSPLFQSYVSQSGSYNLIYGSFAVVVIILVWVFIISLITIFSGELASHIQEMVLRGRSVEEVERDHEPHTRDQRGRNEARVSGNEHAR